LQNQVRNLLEIAIIHRQLFNPKESNRIGQVHFPTIRPVVTTTIRPVNLSKRQTVVLSSILMVLS